MSDIIKMCKMILASPFKKTACEKYPFKPAKFYPRTRGHVELVPSKCILCSLCAKKCPTGAISVDRVNGTWQINRFKCILCNECVTSCKPNALIMANQYTKPSATKDIESHSVEIKKTATQAAETKTE